MPPSPPPSKLSTARPAPPIKRADHQHQHHPLANHRTPSMSIAKKRRASKLLDPLQMLTLVVTGSASSAGSGQVGKAPPSSASTGKLKCSMCASTFGRRCELKRHVAEVHTHNGARRFRCTHPTCGKSFTRRDALAKHNVVKHQGKRRFVCPTCSEKFTSRYDLSRHTIRVHSNVKKRFTCEHCAAGFSQKSQLTMHKGRVHASLVAQSGDVPKTVTAGGSTEAENSPISSDASPQPSMERDGEESRCGGQPGAIDSLAAVAAAMANATDHVTAGPPRHVQGTAKRPKLSQRLPASEAAAAVLGADALLEAAAVLQPAPSERRALSETAGSVAETELGCDMSVHGGEESEPIGDDELAENRGAEVKTSVTDADAAHASACPNGETVRQDDGMETV